MKHLFTLMLAVLLGMNTALAQTDPIDEIPRQRYGIDISFCFVSAFPQSEFDANFGQNILPGLNFDFSFTPAQTLPFWKMGLQVEMLFSRSQKDNWDDIKLKTRTDFISVNLLHRLMPIRQMNVKPFFEFAFGINTSYTLSHYRSKSGGFIDWILDDYYGDNMVTVKDHDDISKNISVGAGLIIRKNVLVSLKYNYAADMKYVSPHSITVQGNDVIYNYYNSPITLLSISLGLTLNTRQVQRQ
ncbi:porin family protein [Mangrovibacterium lignilyticum]|uniref:hypothetical protein n=1 Tax=Mangrovibacterium lignilyticum TaxID=2668052 RepID=UPI0013D71453|nr:hypothetical protein [Mangrovibacterium lignilyticum]